jgi:hypothetical protein
MGNADSKSIVDDDAGIAAATVSSKRSKDSIKTNGTNDHHNSNDPADDNSSEKREGDKPDPKRGSGSKRDNALTPGQQHQNHPHRLSDDQINVNMAMADLMAYLQVVANNSNHLPLTRRDDPELDRTVSTLSAEDFARKSAAFVPADVRIMGGTFTRYGRVWDLPTSEVCVGCVMFGDLSRRWLFTTNVFNRRLC